MTPRPTAPTARSPRWTRHLATAALLLAALWRPDAARADCPPPPQPPSAEEVQALQRNARDHGLLWRLDKDGRTGWLFGTLHVGRRDWLLPGPRLAEALRAADTLALELDFGNAEAMELGLNEGMATMRQREAGVAMPPALADRLATLRRGLCAEGLASQPALMQSLSLSVLAARGDGLEAAYAQEFALMGLARAGGKAVVGLESVAAQMAALTPDTPAALLATIDSAVVQLETGATRRQVVALAEAWAAGDVARLTSWETWCECILDEEDRRLMRRLNEGRNAPMAERIDALLAEGRRLLVAVGALHMTGAQGLPALMGQRGWTVTRVVPP